MVRLGYRLGVPKGGPYAELLNTDAECYAGSGVGNAGRVEAEEHEAHGRPFSLVLDLPPLATLVLKPLTPVVEPVVVEEVIEAEPEQQAQTEGTDGDPETDSAR